MHVGRYVYIILCKIEQDEPMLICRDNTIACYIVIVYKHIIRYNIVVIIFETFRCRHHECKFRNIVEKNSIF